MVQGVLPEVVMNANPPPAKRVTRRIYKKDPNALNKVISIPIHPNMLSDLRRTANRYGMTFTQLSRKFISDGLERLNGSSDKADK